MEFREIVTFVQVAQLKSFSKAAKHLGYSQAAVTIQIKQLEQELNINLFDRIGKQTILTHQGMVFYEHAINIMHEMKRAKAALSESSELKGRLCLGTIESICSSIFPALLQEYHRLYPNVNVNVITDTPENLLTRMKGNSIDLVYFLDKKMYDPKWVKVLEEPEEIVFVASSNHPFAKESNLGMEQVITQPLILTEREASYRFILEQYLAASGKEIRPFLEIGNTEFIINRLRDNLGVSFLPKFAIWTEVAAEHLVILEVKNFHMCAWRQVVYHKDKWVTAEMKAFIKLAQTYEGGDHPSI